LQFLKKFSRGGAEAVIVHDTPLDKKSPLEDVPGIKTTATMQDIVEMLHESHAGI
jgi:hypothetical protein